MIKFSSPERLDERIAPAGLVTVTFANGLLTIAGPDGADHNVEIVKTGVNAFRVEGLATDINELGQTSKSFRGALTKVLIEGGAGADKFVVTNLDPLKSFRFNGNAGVDTLSTANLKTSAGGSVEIALGSEAGSVEFLGSRTTVNGALNVDLGGGGTLALRSAVTTVNGEVTVTGGPGSDSVSVTGNKTLFKSKLNYTGGEGDDSFSAAGELLNVRGIVTMDGGAGTDMFLFAADTNKFGNTVKPGALDLRLGEGTGTVTFLGKSTTVLADLKIDLGTGGGTAQLNSLATTVRENLQVTGGAGNDNLNFQGRTSIGKTLSFVGDVGDDTLTATGSMAVKGATSMDGGIGASRFDLNLGHIALAGLTVTGGTSNDTVSIIADGTIAGDANLQLGLDGIGPSSTILKSFAGLTNGLKFGGTLTIDMIGATVDVLTIANIQVAKAFVAQTGEGVSTVDLSRLNAKNDFRLQTGSGADVVNIDNVNARDFTVDTQIGADELRIERNATYVGGSQVLGTATILTGIGADQIRVGNSSDSANLKVSFKGALTLDAGDGANMRNDILASNLFASVPMILTTGGTLTQTEAV
ncbi:MAG: outer rane autotransporter [Chthoniobacter sp.]|nr:outer rane autotransporter [Chthoniobacter sp.]